MHARVVLGVGKCALFREVYKQYIHIVLQKGICVANIGGSITTIFSLR